MRHALLALFALILFIAGCGGDDAACAGACKTAEVKYRLDERTIRDVDQRAFTSEGKTYTLVRVEYGDTEECDLFGEDCSYSTYCGFVVDGVDYPLEVNFVTDEDALFDLDDYCADSLVCELPGYELPIFDDEAFDDWLWETDSEDDVLIECFAGY